MERELINVIILFKKFSFSDSLRDIQPKDMQDASQAMSAYWVSKCYVPGNFEESSRWEGLEQK